MTIQHHTTNLELSKRLKELGLCQKSIFYWHKRDSGWEIADWDDKTTSQCSAYLASELGEMLPNDVFSGKRLITSNPIPDENPHTEFDCWNNGFGGGEIFADTEANARAKMLIYLIENKIVDVETINNNYLKI